MDLPRARDRISLYENIFLECKLEKKMCMSKDLISYNFDKYVIKMEGFF